MNPAGCRRVKKGGSGTFFETRSRRWLTHRWRVRVSACTATLSMETFGSIMIPGSRASSSQRVIRGTHSSSRPSWAESSRTSWRENRTVGRNDSAGELRNASAPRVRGPRCSDQPLRRSSRSIIRPESVSVSCSWGETSLRRSTLKRPSQKAGSFVSRMTGVPSLRETRYLGWKR